MSESRIFCFTCVFLHLLTFVYSRSENSWDGVDVCHRRLWYGSLPADYPVEQLLSKPELRPLLVGATDAKLSAWMENWTEDKHNILTRHLLKASKFLSPSQVQILAAPLLSGDVSMFNVVKQHRNPQQRAKTTEGGNRGVAATI